MPAEPVIIESILLGWQEFVAGAQAEAASLKELGVAAGFSAKGMDNATRRSNLYTQALFTARRVTYAGTLALLAAGAAVLKLGYNYTSAMQQSTVALEPFFKNNARLKSELLWLYRFSAFTPFQFKDITIAFRQLYTALRYAPDVKNPIETTNKTLQSVTDALSVSGKNTPANLQRVSIALQHMAFSGRLTGYAVNQLARDGINLLPVLNKQFGITGEQLHRIGSMNIPVGKVLDAINKFYSTSAYKGAAARQALLTLHGAFTTFKDLLSQASAGSSSGSFGFLQGFFAKTDKYLYTRYTSKNKPLTMEEFFKGVNSALTPNTGIILNFFYLLQGVLQGVGLSLLALKYALTIVLSPLRIFMIGGDGLKYQFKILGIVLGIYLTLLVLYKTYTMAAAVAEGIHATAIATKNIVLGIATALTGGYTAVTEGAAFAQLMLATASYRLAAAMVIATVTTRASAIGLGLWEATMGLAAIATAGLTLTVDGLAAAWIALDVAIPVLGWIALAITGFTILYMKSATFRRMVNDTLNFFKSNWFSIATAIAVPFVSGILVVVRMLQTLLRVAKTVYNWFAGHSLVGAFTGLPGAITGGGHGGGGWQGTALGVLKGIGGALIPGLAGGGLVNRAGLSWVGERGPELLNLPAGASVTPAGAGGKFGGGLLNIKVYPQPIIFDSIQVGRAMAQVVTDMEARQ